MGAQIYNFSGIGTTGTACEQGATFNRVIEWQKSTELNPTVFSPVDLTLYTGKMQVRKGYGSTLLAEFSTANGKMILGGVAGTITLLLSASETSALPSGSFIYDLELTDGSGNVTRFLQGNFQVVQQVTL